MPFFTSKELEEFLIQEEAGKFLDLRQESLSKRELNSLMRHVGEFAARRFGLTPSRMQKEEIARAVVGLFPKIKMVRFNNNRAHHLFFILFRCFSTKNSCCSGSPELESHV